MAEKTKKISESKLYFDEALKKIISKSGGDGKEVGIISNRFSFIVFDPNTDYRDLESSLETILKDVQSEIEHQKRKKEDQEDHENQEDQHPPA